MWNCPSDHFHLFLLRLLGMSSRRVTLVLESEIAASDVLHTSGVCPSPAPSTTSTLAPVATITPHGPALARCPCSEVGGDGWNG